MAATIPSAALVPVTPVFTNTERLALAGFLADYSGLTRHAYELDLRQYAAWCQQHQLRLFAARRADSECFARDLEARGRNRAGRRPRGDGPLPAAGPAGYRHDRGWGGADPGPGPADGAAGRRPGAARR